MREAGPPADLKPVEAGGEVERYWLPDSFTWYTPSGREGFYQTPYVRCDRSSLRISSAATHVAGWRDGDRVQVGVNGRYLAVRRAESGLQLRREKKDQKESRALVVMCTGLVRWLEQRGFRRLERLPVVYDARSDMLVAERPEEVGA
jgi:hypothetical protein